MKVELLSHTPQPERLIAAASRLCYSAAGLEDLMDALTPQKAADQVRLLASMGHESPMEHITFTFGVEGVSRSLLAQLTRHRIASYSVQSQRYVEEAGVFDYVTPPQIAQLPEARAEFEAVMAQIAEHYHHLTELLYERQLAALPEEQRREKSACTAARKRAIEDARYVLPNACDTKLIFTMNARSLFNFFRHRCCNRAQWEIRRLAEEMFRLVYAAAPTVFEGAGPACVREGRCPEGKMSCGRMEEMRRRYAAFREGEG